MFRVILISFLSYYSYVQRKLLQERMISKGLYPRINNFLIDRFSVETFSI